MCRNIGTSIDRPIMSLMSIGASCPLTGMCHKATQWEYSVSTCHWAPSMTSSRQENQHLPPLAASDWKIQSLSGTSSGMGRSTIIAKALAINRKSKQFRQWETHWEESKLRIFWPACLLPFLYLCTSSPVLLLLSGFSIL